VTLGYQSIRRGQIIFNFGMDFAASYVANVLDRAVHDLAEESADDMFSAFVVDVDDADSIVDQGLAEDVGVLDDVKDVSIDEISNVSTSDDFVASTEANMKSACSVNVDVCIEAQQVDPKIGAISFEHFSVNPDSNAWDIQRHRSLRPVGAGMPLPKSPKHDLLPHLPKKADLSLVAIPVPPKPSRPLPPPNVKSVQTMQGAGSEHGRSWAFPPARPVLSAMEEDLSADLLGTTPRPGALGGGGEASPFTTSSAFRPLDVDGPRKITKSSSTGFLPPLSPKVVNPSYLLSSRVRNI